MTLPSVDISLANGRMGAVAAVMDGVAGLALSGTAVADNIGLNDPKQIFSFADMIALGITEANNEFAWNEIKRFYEVAGDGAELWIVLFSDASVLADICENVDTSTVYKLLDAAQGRIRLVAVNRKAPLGYTPTVTTGIDQDVVTAITNLHATLEAFAANYMPARALLPGHAWDGDTATLIDLRANATNRVGVVLAAENADGDAAIARSLGRLAAIEVHRNIGRVKDGAVALEAYMTDGSTSVSHKSKWDVLHEKGFIFLRTYQGKNGFFYNDDPVSAPVTDDYSQLAQGRVIDKAIVIAYSTYVNELLDNVEVDDVGKIAASVCKYFESIIENAVNANMVNQISNFSAFVDPAQNVLSTSQMTVVLEIVPVGTLRKIVVELGFSNPALS